MAQLSIIGSGFGALTAARRLRKHMPDADITLIAPDPALIYYSSLIWVPSGLRSGDDLRIDVSGFLQKHNIRYHQGRVTGLRENGRVVVTDHGELRNDGLLIASGGRFLKKLPGIEHAITICEGIASAKRLRDGIKNLSGGTIAIGFAGNPKEPAAVRGGPMFEVLFGLDTQLRREGRRDKFKLVFFNPASRPGQRLGDRAVDGILKEMAKRDIEPHLGHKMVHMEENKVVTEGGEIDCDLIAFMPGMTGPDWAAESGLTLSEGGLFKADAHCKVEGAEHVYVAGDAGSFPGPAWMPKQAHMADLQAEAAAANLTAELQGKPATAPFQTELLCIIDSLDKGILVYRNEKRTIIFPSFLFHYAKRFFEWWYLRRYRLPPSGNPASMATQTST